MTSKYAKLNKPELLLVIDQLEDELVEARSSTLNGVVEQVVSEAKLLGQDLVKVIAAVYNAGAKARRFVSGIKFNRPQLAASAVEVVEVGDEFEY